MYSEDFDRNIVVPIPFIEIGPQLPDYYVDWEARVEWQQSIEEARREEFEDFAPAQDYWKRSLTPYNLTIELERREAAQLKHQQPIELAIHLAATKLTGFGRIVFAKRRKLYLVQERKEKESRVPGIYWDEISVGTHSTQLSEQFWWGCTPEEQRLWDEDARREIKGSYHTV